MVGKSAGYVISLEESVFLFFFFFFLEEEREKQKKKGGRSSVCSTGEAEAEGKVREAAAPEADRKRGEHAPA